MVVKTNLNFQDSDFSSQNINVKTRRCISVQVYLQGHFDIVQQLIKHKISKQDPTKPAYSFLEQSIICDFRWKVKSYTAEDLHQGQENNLCVMSIFEAGQHCTNVTLNCNQITISSDPKICCKIRLLIKCKSLSKIDLSLFTNAH